MSDSNRFVRNLQHSFLRQRLLGAETPVTFPSLIESDKRSQARIVRELTDAKLLAADTAHDRPEDRRQFILPAVLDNLMADEPDLIALRAAGAWGGSDPGVPVERLTDGQIRWLLDHPDDYSGTWRKGSQAAPCARMGEQPPKSDPKNYFGTWELWVTSPALTARVTAEERAKTIADLFRRNIAAALTDLAHVTEADAKPWYMRSAPDDEGRSGFLLGDHGLSFALGHDPATWEADAEAVLVTAGKRLQAALEDIGRVVRVRAAVSNMGGWKAIADGLRQLVVAHVDKPAEPELATAETPDAAVSS